MKNKFQNIITLIKEDHQPLKEGIRTLTSENAKPAEKKRALKAFLKNLKLHAKAEEMSLYHNEKEEKSVRHAILEGYVEHALADLLARKLESEDIEQGLTDEVQAKATVLAELVKHHLEEEEETTLPELKEAVDEERLEELGRLYLEAKRQLQESFSKTPQPGNAEKSRTKASRDEKGDSRPLPHA